MQWFKVNQGIRRIQPRYRINNHHIGNPRGGTKHLWAHKFIKGWVMYCSLSNIVWGTVNLNVETFCVSLGTRFTSSLVPAENNKAAIPDGYCSTFFPGQSGTCWFIVLYLKACHIPLHQAEDVKKYWSSHSSESLAEGCCFQAHKRSLGHLLPSLAVFCSILLFPHVDNQQPPHLLYPFCLMGNWSHLGELIRLL